MSKFLRASGWLGALLTIVVLVIALLKQLIAFVGFLMFAIKAGLVILFLGLMVMIVVLFFTTRKKHKREREGF
jgi:uncharacterized membrane protein